jgi:hypothetical protein
MRSFGLMGFVSFFAALPASADALDRLLTEELPNRIGGPGVLEVRLGSQNPDEALGSPAELELLSRRRSEVVARLLPELERRGSPIAALVLGHLRERRALAALRRWYLESRDFYGWETSSPCYVEPANHPARHAYEEAWRHITGRPLVRAVRLEADELAHLERAARQGEEGPLYALYRLSPERARQVVAADFRNSRDPDARFFLVYMIAEHFVELGLSPAAVVAEWGSPDELDGPVWRYFAEGVRPVALELTFRGGRLASARVSEQPSGLR